MEGLSPEEILGALVADENPSPVLELRGGRVTRANRAAREALGPELVGMELETLVEEGSRDKLRGALAADRAVACELQLRGPGDLKGPMRFLTVPHDGTQLLFGAPPGFGYTEEHARHFAEASAQLTNLTRELARQRAELKSSAEELRRLIALRDQFIATLSHDVRSPLSAIHLQAAALERLELSPTLPELRRRAEMIQRNAERVVALTDKVLDMARIEAGSLELQRAPIYLADLAREVVETLGAVAEDAAVELQLVGARGGPVEADEDRIFQVLANLLDNAIRHSPAGGLVRLVIAEDAVRARCSIEDQGPGVPAKLRDRLFQPFTQGGAHAGSAGLGLFIARQLVELHGGRLWISDAQPVGARFSFELPKGPR